MNEPLQMSPITVDANNLFRTVGRYFPDPSVALQEVIQNAYRATLHLGDQARITIILTEGKASRDWTNVEVRDNGHGIEDFGRMLSLATSDWEGAVKSTQDPAGMGVAASLRFCDRTIWESRGQLIEVEGGQFFSSPEYRAELAPRRIAAQPGTAVLMEDFRLPLGRTLGVLQEILAPYRLPIQVLVDDKPHKFRRLEDVLRASELVSANPRYEVYRINRSTLQYGNLESRLVADGSSVVWHGHILPIGHFTRPAPYRFRGRTLQGDKRSLAGMSARLVVIPLVDGVVTPILPARQAVVEDQLLDTLLADLITEELTRHASELAQGIERAVKTAEAGMEPARIEGEVIRWMGRDYVEWARDLSRGLAAYRDPSDTDLRGTPAYPLRYGRPPGQYLVEAVVPWLGGSYGDELEDLGGPPRLHVQYRAGDHETPRLLTKVRHMLGLGDHGIPSRQLVVDLCEEVGHPQYGRLGKKWRRHAEPVKAWLIPGGVWEAAVRDSTPPWSVEGVEEIQLAGIAWSKLDHTDPAIPHDSFAFGSLTFAEQAIELWFDSLAAGNHFDDGEQAVETLRRDTNRLIADLSGKLALSRVLTDLQEAIPGWRGLEELTIDPKNETVRYRKGDVEITEVYR